MKNMQDIRQLLERMQFVLKQAKKSVLGWTRRLRVRRQRQQRPRRETQHDGIGDLNLGRRHVHDAFGLERRTVSVYYAAGFDRLWLGFRMNLELQIDQGVDW